MQNGWTDLYETQQLLKNALIAIVNRLYHNAEQFHELPEKLQNDLINKARAALKQAE